MPTVSRGLYGWLVHGGAVLEDFADRLSHVWTFGILLVLASVVSWNQSVNQPIKCWTPVEFTRAMTDYAESTCWRSGRYYLPLEDRELPLDQRPDPEGPLYRWLPLLLCLQAVLFKLPNIIMHVLHGYSGVDFEKILGCTRGYENLNIADRQHLGQQTGRFMYTWCKPWAGCLPWRLLSVTWLLVKLAFCLNTLIQFVLVDKLVSNRNPPFDNSTSYGDTIHANIFDTDTNITEWEWKASPIFPRTILCDFPVRQIGNVHLFTVQCDLPANEFNEYVYMMVWSWLLVVTVVSFISFGVWLLLTLLPFPRQSYSQICSYMIVWSWLLVVTVVSFFSFGVWLLLTLQPFPRQRYVSRMLALSEDPGTSNDASNNELSSLIGEYGVVNLFSWYVSRMLALSEDPGTSNAAGKNQLSSLIGEDGVMVLKLISANSSEHLVRDVVAAMFQLAQRQTPYSYAPVATQPAQPSAPTAAGSGVPQQPGVDVTTVAQEASVYPSLKA